MIGYWTLHCNSQFRGGQGQLICTCTSFSEVQEHKWFVPGARYRSTTDLYLCQLNSTCACHGDHFLYLCQVQVNCTLVQITWYHLYLSTKDPQHNIGAACSNCEVAASLRMRDPRNVQTLYNTNRSMWNQITWGELKILHKPSSYQPHMLLSWCEIQNGNMDAYRQTYSTHVDICRHV